MIPSDVLIFAGGAALKRHGVLAVGSPNFPAFGDELVMLETHTRAGNEGTIVTPSGYVVNQADPNVPRVSHWNPYDGSLLDPPVLFLEDLRVNELLHSEDVATTWLNYNSYDSTNSDEAPNGATVADRIREDGTMNAHGLYQGLTGLTAAANYVFSVFAKKGNLSDWIALQIHDDPGGSDYVRVWFDIVNGAVGGNSTGGTASLTRAYVEEYVNNWSRAVLVGKVGGTHTAARATIWLADANNSYVFQEDSTKYQKVWGMMFEDDVDYASSYIKTISSAVTRQPDKFTVPYPYPPMEQTIYLKFLECQSTTDGEDLMIIADPALTAPFLHVQKANPAISYSASYYAAPLIYADEWVLLNATAGDMVELCVYLSPNGALQVRGSKNGGAETVSTMSSDTFLPPAWYTSGSPTVHINSRGQYSVGYTGLEALVVARGNRSLAEFRGFLP